jgi:HAD superfamily hydrolase (TIGR01509 family)
MPRIFGINVTLFVFVAVQAFVRCTQSFTVCHRTVMTTTSIPVVVSSSTTTSLRSTKKSVDIAAPYATVEAVLFDVDGTLADSGQLGYDATRVVLENNNYEMITYDEYCEGCRYTTPDRLARHIGLTPEQDGDEYYRMGRKLGEQFDNLYIDLVSTETAAFFPGILDLINNIPKEIPIGVLTNAAGRYAHGVLKANDMTVEGSVYERFGSILGADDVPKPKPYGDGLLQVCRELNVNPTECVYIGDSPSDALAATAAGMPSIGVTWGAHKADRLLPHVSHLCRTVDELACLVPQCKTFSS